MLLKKYLVPILSKIQYFTEDHMIPPDDLWYVAQHLEFNFLNSGDDVFRHGDSGDKFYIIL